MGLGVRNVSIPQPHLCIKTPGRGTIWYVVACPRIIRTRMLKFLCECIQTKEYIERRHGEPFKFLFLPKMGLLGSQASTRMKYPTMNYELLFHHFMGKTNLSFFFRYCSVRTKKLQISLL